MSTITFGRDKTQILKGIALLLMLVHHTSHPSYWSERGMPLYSYFEHQVASTKICVYIFAFLIGCGFYCSKNKTLKYSFKRILLLIVPFWAYFGSDKMARVSAVYHTIISPCKMQGVSVLDYFKKFFSEIVKGRRDYEHLLSLTIRLNQ